MVLLYKREMKWYKKYIILNTETMETKYWIRDENKEDLNDKDLRVDEQIIK